MKKNKPKFVQIIMTLGSGCSTQISEKQSYILNPRDSMAKKGIDCEIWTTMKNGGKKIGPYFGIKVDKDITLVYGHLRPYPPALLSPIFFKKCILMTQTYELGSNWLAKKISLFFMKRFTRIFALTPYEREEYIKNGLSRDKVVFFPHAIDYSFFSKKPKKDLDKIRRKYGVSKDDFVITSIANFRKFKNLDIMVGAFALFNKNIKKSKMFVVGKDQTKNSTYREQSSKRYRGVEDVGEVIKKEKISEKVIFTGSLRHKEVRDILYISDLFVNSSDPEGMGMAIYEAASAGVPLCLSNIGSFTSVFKDMAIYSSPRDKKKLAENYLKYYKNPSLRKKIGKRLKQYIKNWDYPLAMKKFDKIFSEILD